MTDVFKGATDQTIFVELVDSTTGLPKTGIVYTDVTGSYSRTRSARVAITMATLASASSSHADGGFILVDDTNQPGVYRVDIPDAAFATGASEVVCTFKATGCRTASRSINLVNINNQVAYVPNAAADAAGGLPISDAGGLDLDAKLANTNEVTAARMGALTDWINGGRLDLILDIIAQDTTTDIPALISTAFASLQVNTRANLQVPVEIETPDTGTQVFKIKLHLFDVEGNMEAPDSTPTIALVNAAGTDRSSRLSAATVVSTGAYSWDYTATAADAEEQLNWMFTVVEGGLTRLYPATSYVVEESAYRFSSTDRNTLNAAATQVSVNDLPTNAELAAALAAGVNVTGVDGSTLGTHGIGMFPADVRDVGGLGATIAVDSETNYPAVAALHVHTDAISADAVSAAAVTKIQNGLATASELLLVKDRTSYCLTVLVGACADAGTAAETYVHTIGGETFTVDFTGLDDTGTRTTTTLSKV